MELEYPNQLKKLNMSLKNKNPNQTVENSIKKSKKLLKILNPKLQKHPLIPKTPIQQWTDHIDNHLFFL